ncbi:MAG TPA: hypothetical protein VG621_01925 [Candidatus Paceibacterota bacterium]|nr:hypothetical protein [Candidatus Paceibacterota bacterium]
MHSSSFRPSKQFLIRGGSAIAIVALILIVQTNWFKKLFHRTPPTAAITKDMSVGDIVNKDSNGNGIPDWQERLWGLDPTVVYTNGVPNKQIIEDKQKALGISSDDTQNLSETDSISRQLFAITTALGQSDTIDATTLQQVAGSLGSSINLPQVADRYFLKEIKTVSTTTRSLKTYYANMSKIVSKYNTDTADIGTVIDALQTGDTSGIPALAQSATLYNQFAHDMTTIAVPIGVAQYHLAIMNSFAGIAQSFTYLQQIDDNSIQSLVGVAIYKGYADKLQKALDNMDDYLTRYGILNS